MCCLEKASWSRTSRKSGRAGLTSQVNEGHSCVGKALRPRSQLSHNCLIEQIPAIKPIKPGDVPTVLRTSVDSSRQQKLPPAGECSVCELFEGSCFCAGMGNLQHLSASCRHSSRGSRLVRAASIQQATEAARERCTISCSSTQVTYASATTAARCCSLSHALGTCVGWREPCIPKPSGPTTADHEPQLLWQRRQHNATCIATAGWNQSTQPVTQRASSACKDTFCECCKL